VINFLDDRKGTVKRAMIQVKSGHIKSGDIRDLKGVLDREKAQIGIFITLEPSSSDMKTESVSAGYYHSEIWDKDYLRIQILTIDDILNGKKPEIPPTPRGAEAFKRADKVKDSGPKQGQLDL
jgi:site-specific DNA-methyltransferase (adenine-specific)